MIQQYRPEHSQRKNSTLPPELWEQLKQQPGEGRTEWKRRKQREVMRFWRARNPERNLQNARDYYALNTYKVIQAKITWNAKNPGKAEKYARDYFERNREQRLEMLNKWGRDNPERFLAAKKQWLEDNKGVMAHHASVRRASELQATPWWVDREELKDFYLEARVLTIETGVEHHVDHIVPLQGRDVCGLHVPWNLRVITATENLQKRNKMLDENGELLPLPKRGAHLTLQDLCLAPNVP